MLQTPRHTKAVLAPGLPNETWHTPMKRRTSTNLSLPEHRSNRPYGTDNGRFQPASATAEAVANRIARPGFFNGIVCLREESATEFP